MMIVSESIILVLTVYFFVKVFKAPKKDEPDSFSENDQ